jgi:hypothetical protein
VPADLQKGGHRRLEVCRHIAEDGNEVVFAGSREGEDFFK